MGRPPLHREETWVDRFTNILPKEEIARQLSALHDDLRTPWTWQRMAREIGFKLRPFAISRAARTGQMNPLTQAILSGLINDLASGRLRLQYKNPETRRHIWTNYIEDVDEYHAQLAANKIIRKKTPIAQIAEVKQLQVTLGRSGPKLTPRIKYLSGSNEMPAFNEVVHVKELKK